MNSTKEVLMLPWKRFDYDFVQGNFKILCSSTQKNTALILTQITNQSDQGTGLIVWDSAICFIKLLEINHSKLFPVVPTKILELGTGTGVLGIGSALALGNVKVTVTDLDYCQHNVLRNIGLNADELRSNQSEVSFKTLDWYNIDKEGENDWSNMDCIIGADIVWIQELVQPLVDTISYLASISTNLGFQILIVNQRRSQQVQDSFITLLKEKKLKVDYIDLFHPEFKAPEITAMRITKN